MIPSENAVEAKWTQPNQNECVMVHCNSENRMFENKSKKQFN